MPQHWHGSPQELRPEPHRPLPPLLCRPPPLLPLCKSLPSPLPHPEPGKPLNNLSRRRCLSAPPLTLIVFPGCGARRPGGQPGVRAGPGGDARQDPDHRRREQGICRAGRGLGQDHAGPLPRELLARGGHAAAARPRAGGRRRRGRLPAVPVPEAPLLQARDGGRRFQGRGGLHVGGLREDDVEEDPVLDGGAPARVQLHLHGTRVGDCVVDFLIFGFDFGEFRMKIAIRFCLAKISPLSTAMKKQNKWN